MTPPKFDVSQYNAPVEEPTPSSSLLPKAVAKALKPLLIIGAVGAGLSSGLTMTMPDFQVLSFVVLAAVGVGVGAWVLLMLEDFALASVGALVYGGTSLLAPFLLTGSAPVLWGLAGLFVLLFPMAKLLVEILGEIPPQKKPKLLGLHAKNAVGDLAVLKKNSRSGLRFVIRFSRSEKVVITYPVDRAALKDPDLTKVLSLFVFFAQNHRHGISAAQLNRFSSHEFTMRFGSMLSPQYALPGQADGGKLWWFPLLRFTGGWTIRFAWRTTIYVTF